MSNYILDIKKVSDLLSANAPEKELKKKGLVAVIIDVQRPKKLQHDYIQTIKAVDGSCDQYLTVFYFSKTLEDVAPLDTIGDIIYLKRFHYLQHDGKPQARHNAYKTSQFILLDEYHLKFNPQRCRQFDEVEGANVKRMVEFKKAYFGSVSLLNVFWYPEHDYLLRIKTVGYERHTLEDSQGMEYTLCSRIVGHSGLVQGTVVKLRGVLINQNREIELNNLSNMLRVPNEFHDCKNFNTLDQKIPINQKFIQNQNSSNELFILVTAIKSTYASMQRSKAYQVLNAATSQIFSVNGEIISISPTKLEKALFYQSGAEIEPFILGAKSESQKDLGFFVEITLLLDQVIVCQITDPSFFFPNFDLDEFAGMSTRYDEIMKSLLLSPLPVYADLIIETKTVNSLRVNHVIDTKLN